MSKSWRASITTIVAVVAIVAFPAASFAQVKVIISGGFFVIPIWVYFVGSRS